MSKNRNTPPFVSGAKPVVGHGLEFDNRDELLMRGFREHGPVFAIMLGPQKTAIIVGPDLQRKFYMETDKKLDPAKAYSFLKPIFGEVAFVASPEVYKQQRPVIYEPFKRRKMLKYVDVIYERVQNWLDNLPDEGRIDIAAETCLLAQDVAGYAFMGKDFQEKVGAEFWKHYAALGKALDPFIPHWLPIKKYRNRDKARKKMEKILQPVIAERRANPDKYDDFLQDFLFKPQADGTLMDDKTVRDLLITMMFAGHETTAGQAAWTIIQLLHHPDYLAEVQEEIDAKLSYGQPVDAMKLAALHKVFWAVEETSRMKPSADMQMRFVSEDIEFGGYTVPKGWLIMTAADVAHFLPEYFRNPYKYDPYRFSPERREDRAHRFSMVGFGGGEHKCAGMNFAKNEMSMITALLFQQFHVELETTDTYIERDLGANRASETWLRIRRKPMDELVSNEVIEEAVAAGCPHMRKWQEAQAKQSV